MTASQRFGRSMIPVRSLEQWSCLTRRVTEAERSSSVEKRTLSMLIFNFGNRSKSGGLMSGLQGGWVSTSHLYPSKFHRHPYQVWVERYHAKSRHGFPASLVSLRASYASVFAKIDGSRPQLHSYLSVPCLS